MQTTLATHFPHPYPHPSRAVFTRLWLSTPATVKKVWWALNVTGVFCRYEIPLVTTYKRPKRKRSELFLVWTYDCWTDGVSVNEQAFAGTGWIRLWLIQVIEKVTSLLRVWRYHEITSWHCFRSRETADDIIPRNTRVSLISTPVSLTSTLVSLH